jgi:hypothetical protein
MSCNFIKGGGFTGFQCSINEMGGPNLIEEDVNKGPYEDGECKHFKRFELKGVLTCKDCGATYDEDLMEWLTN